MDVVVKNFGEVYPELVKARATIYDTIKEEVRRGAGGEAHSSSWCMYTAQARLVEFRARQHVLWWCSKLALSPHGCLAYICPPA